MANEKTYTIETMFGTVTGTKDQLEELESAMLEARAQSSTMMAYYNDQDDYEMSLFCLKQWMKYYDVWKAVNDFLEKEVK